MATLLEQTKVALGTTSDDEGIVTEITELIYAGIADLNITNGIETGEVNSPDFVCDGRDMHDVLICRAVKTYVRMHFGEPVNFDELERSYENQKAMLGTAYRNKRRGCC